MFEIAQYSLNTRYELYSEHRILVPLSKKYLDREVLLISILSYVSGRNYKIHIDGAKEIICSHSYLKKLGIWREVKEIPINVYLDSNKQVLYDFNNNGIKEEELNDVHMNIEDYSFSVVDETSTVSLYGTGEWENRARKDLTLRSISGEGLITPDYLRKFFPGKIIDVERILNNPCLEKISNDILYFLNENIPAFNEYNVSFLEDKIYLFSRKKHGSNPEIRKDFIYRSYGINPPGKDVLEIFKTVLFGKIEESSKWHLPKHDGYLLQFPIDEIKRIYLESYQDW